MVTLESLANESYCYLTTVGRVTGQPRTIEIWFALKTPVAYLMAGGGEQANWVRNLRETPAVSVRLGSETFSASARVVTDPAEDALARRLLLAKYHPAYAGDLTEWGRTALPVALELQMPTGGGTHAVGT